MRPSCRSNNSKSYNQTPNVKLGDHVDASDVIANGPTMDHGELRSEERRVGKECRSRWSPYH